MSQKIMYKIFLIIKVRNEFVVWDKILTTVIDHETKNAITVTPETAEIDFKNIEGNFPLIDPGNNLRGISLNYTLNWEIFPHSGLIFKQKSHKSYSYTLPKKYY
jgi:hypothetical protein